MVEYITSCDRPAATAVETARDHENLEDDDQTNDNVGKGNTTRCCLLGFPYLLSLLHLIS